MHRLMCEEQHMHNERVWNIKYGLVHHSFLWALLLDELLTSTCLATKEKKNYVGSENYSPMKRSHFGTEYCKAPPPRKGKEKSMGIRRVAGLA